MRHCFLLTSAALLLATPGLAAPGDRQAANPMGTRADKMTAPAKARPTADSVQRPTNGAPRYQRPEAGTRTRPVAESSGIRPAYKSAATRDVNNNRAVAGTRPVTSNRPISAGNTVVTGNTIVVPGNNRYPVYRPPGGGYYRPPNGGYYRPPPPPPGGWGGGYYPPPRYQYDDGPSVGDVIAGVAVTGTLLYVLSEATKPKQQTVVVQGGPPPMPPPPQPYVPPKNSTGAPATINVNLGGLTPEARPAASVCITEASRQIGATGGTEIRIDRIVDVQPGNGGYRFRVNLLGVYPDETRNIPMYCRATPEKIIELTFG